MSKDDPKMSVTFQLRIPLYLRNKFSEVAKSNKKVPSRLIREFMHRYIAENTRDAKQG